MKLIGRRIINVGDRAPELQYHVADSGKGAAGQKKRWEPVSKLGDDENTKQLVLDYDAEHGTEFEAEQVVAECERGYKVRWRYYGEAFDTVETEETLGRDVWLVANWKLREEMREATEKTNSELAALRSSLEQAINHIVELRKEHEEASKQVGELRSNLEQANAAIVALRSKLEDQNTMSTPAPTTEQPIDVERLKRTIAELDARFAANPPTDDTDTQRSFAALRQDMTTMQTNTDKTIEAVLDSVTTVDSAVKTLAERTDKLYALSRTKALEMCTNFALQQANNWTMWQASSVPVEQLCRLRDTFDEQCLTSNARFDAVVTESRLAEYVLSNEEMEQLLGPLRAMLTDSYNTFKNKLYAVMSTPKQLLTPERCAEIREDMERQKHQSYQGTPDDDDADPPALLLSKAGADAFLQQHGCDPNLWTEYQIDGITEYNLSTKSVLTVMDCSKFLKLVPPLDESVYSKDKADRIRDGVRSKSPLPVAQLKIAIDRDGGARITEHEGRHRATVLIEELGAGAKMPVRLNCTDRWLCQALPNHRDYLVHWPTELKAQVGDTLESFSAVAGTTYPQWERKEANKRQKTSPQ